MRSMKMKFPIGKEISLNDLPGIVKMPEKCPKCGSGWVAWDTDDELDEDTEEFTITRHFNFCWDCGHEWNIYPRKKVKR